MKVKTRLTCKSYWVCFFFFAVSEEVNLLELCGEIRWESRCRRKVVGVHCRSLAVVPDSCFISAGHAGPLVLALDEEKFCLSTLPSSIITARTLQQDGVCAPRGCFVPVFPHSHYFSVTPFRLYYPNLLFYFYPLSKLKWLWSCVTAIHCVCVYLSWCFQYIQYEERAI